MTQKTFGSKNGSDVILYTLTNTNGIEIDITNYGGIVTRLVTPDKNGQQADIVLGYSDFESYLKATPYFGSLIGRFGNRINAGKFTLNGRQYTLNCNENGRHLHGGNVGFDKVIWDAQPAKQEDSCSLKLRYISPDGEEGYPGTLTTDVEYKLTNNNELVIAYTATTDIDTVLNLTHHSYFNLAGDGSGDIFDHVAEVNASRFAPVDDNLMPTGDLLPVKETPFDFTSPARLGEVIHADHEQLKIVGGGVDHSFALDKHGDALAPAAIVTEPTSGRTLEVETTEPALQFYTGNMLDGTLAGKAGAIYAKHTGFCMEAQHYPNSPNRPEFPSTVLKPEETYKQVTLYRFGVEK
ncbi:MAG: galactose-1-epimerase [Chitinivibrionales bacterium]|nr:galactose-1-epimerase [Chitinivibrionales bacterium]